MVLKDIVASWSEASSDHSPDTGRWYLDGAVMAVDLGPFVAGEVVARLSIVIRPLGDGRAFVIFYRSEEDVASDEETYMAELELALSTMTARESSPSGL